MRIVVLGATGPTGRLIVESALARGHEVTALARDAAARFRFADDPLLRVACGDVFDADAMSEIMTGHDAVVSVLGTRQRLGDVRLYSESMRAVLEAMSRAGVRRIVCTSSAGAGGAGNSAVPLFFRAVVIPLLASREWADMARMEELLEASDAEWTAVKPLWLRNGPARGGVRIEAEPFAPRGWGVRRADLAAVLLGLAEEGGHVRERVWIAY